MIEGGRRATRNIAALAALVAGLVVLAPTAQARVTANPVLRVNFQLDGTMTTYLAFVDGEAVGFGRDVFTRHGVLLLGGAVLPDARGQGVYTALAIARWAHAAERGAQRLVVSAGPQSAPVLEHLGFEPMGKVRLLRQKVT